MGVCVCAGVSNLQSKSIDMGAWNDFFPVCNSLPAKKCGRIHGWRPKGSVCVVNSMVPPFSCTNIRFFDNSFALIVCVLDWNMHKRGNGSSWFHACVRWTIDRLLHELSYVPVSFLQCDWISRNDQLFSGYSLLFGGTFDSGISISKFHY